MCDDSEKIITNSQNIKLSIDKIESEYTSEVLNIVDDANQREIK